MIVPTSSVLASGSSSCDLDRSREMVVGGAGEVNRDGVSHASEQIPAACQGEGFSLTGSNPGDDFDVCWHASDGSEIGCDASPGDEMGTIPADAREANITYWSGVQGTYNLSAPVDQGSSGGTVTDDVDLFLHSGPTGVGPADLLGDGSYMDEQEPSDPQPSVWYSTPVVTGGNPNTLYEANWQWTPEDGFSLSGATATVTFWTVSPGSAIDSNGWDVQLFADGEAVDSASAENLAPAQSGVPTKWQVTVGPFEASGDSLTLQINPTYTDADWTHAILYDSPDYPSSVDIDVDATVESTGDLEATLSGSTFAKLTWAEADLGGSLDRYRVYRATGTGPLGVVGHAQTNEFLDTGLSPDTSYRYEVAAVSYAGDEVSTTNVLDLKTDPEDNQAPAIQSVDVSSGGTVATVSWSTDEFASGTVTATGPDGTTHTVETDLGFNQTAHVTGLDPGSTYDISIEATDLAGNARTSATSTTTEADETYYLHASGGLHADLLDTAGDNDARGYNALAQGFDRANENGVDVGPTRDVYNVRAPHSPDLILDTARAIDGTLYVKHSPPGGSVQNQNVGTVALNLSLIANGGQLLGSQVVEQDAPASAGWIPFEYEIAPAFDRVEAGSLKITVTPESGTSGYVFGYEGDHASQVTLPVDGDVPVQASVDRDDPVMADRAADFTAEASGGVAPYTYEWDLDGDGVTDATGASVQHAFATRGPQTVELTVTDATGASATETLSFQVLQRDFTDGPRTVVAVVDSGVNPYHPVYQRPGIDLPLDAFRNENAAGDPAPTTVDLADSGDYDTRVKSHRKDRATWENLSTEQLVHFNDTNVLGISFNGNDKRPTLDSGMHGTATSSTVLEAFPDATIVMVQTSSLLYASTDPLSDIEPAFEWAVNQSWIDVISFSLGDPGNAPVPTEIPQYTRAAAESGKVLVGSAGNDPSPSVTDPFDGPPWVISVSGSQEAGKSKEVMSSNVYPDFVSNYTVQAAQSGTVEDDYTRIGGTSFSAPTVSGTIAGIVHSLRESTGHATGIQNGEIAPGYTSDDVRDALNRTALQPARDGYKAGLHWNGDHAHPPVAPYTTAHWGQVDARVIDPAIDALLSDTLDVPPDKAQTALYQQAGDELRKAYWDAQFAVN